MENRGRKDKRKQETNTTLDTEVDIECHKKRKIVDGRGLAESNQGKIETKRRSRETSIHQKGVRRAREQHKLTEKKERGVEKGREVGISFWRETFLKMCLR